MDPEIKKKIDELEAKVNSLTAEKEDLVKANTTAKGEYEEKLSSLEKTNTELSEKVKTLEGAVEAKSNEISTISAELEKANKDIKANQTEARLNAVSAYLTNMDDEEKKLVRVEAETRDEGNWNSYVKILEKVAKTTVDTHVVASLGILPTNNLDEQNKLFPNVSSLLKK